MYFVFHFDIASLIILLFLLLGLVFRKQYDARNNRFHLLIIVSTFLAGVFDILGSITTFSALDLTIFNSFYLFFRTGITFSFFFYLLSLSDSSSKVMKNKIILVMLLVPMLIVVALIIINIFTKKVFYYEENAAYHREYLLYIQYAMNYFYAGASLVLIILRRKNTSLIKFIAFIFIGLLQICASILHFFAGGLLIEIFSCTCGLFLLQLFIERGEDYLDYTTQIYNSNAFNKYIKERIDLNKNFNVLLIHITNYSRLYSIFSRGTSIHLIRKMSLSLTNKARTIDKNCHTYYIDQGTYAIVYNNDNTSSALVDGVIDFFTQNISETKTITFVLEPKICLVKYPFDFVDKDSLINFSLSFYNIIESKEEIISIEKYKYENEINLLFALDEIINKAIENKSFEMYYQPLYNIKSAKFETAEALVRLNAEKYGLISPGLFIPYAEKIGKMLEIGNIILEKTIEFAGSERFKELDLEYVEINLSIKQLQDINLIKRINSLVEKYNAKKENINFELTETIAINGDKIVEDNIFNLAENGFKLSLDDFGVGYSNVARLFKLPFSLIKIDKMIIDQLEHNELHNVFEELIKFITKSNLKVVAEGVETKEKAEIAKALNIDYIQGFYYSKPLPEKQFIDFLNKENK